MVPTLSTRKEFIEAAKKGHGRAIAALQEGDLKVNYNVIRRLILRWPGHDGQLEESRGWYSVELLKASGHEERLVSLLLQLARAKKGPRRQRWHREAVVCELAFRGHFEAIATIKEAFDPADDFRFNETIIALDGLTGLEWVLEHG